LRLAAGLLRPDSGQVLVAGKPAGSREALANLGFIPEEPSFPLGKTLEAFLTEQILAAGLNLQEGWAQAQALLETLDLGWARRKRLTQFSRGMKQKAALVAALLGSPALLLADEPTSGMDPQAAITVRHLLLELKRKGGAALVSSHRLDEMVKVCDRALFLKGGRIVHQWTPESSETVCWQVAFAPPLPEAVLAALSGYPGVASVQLHDGCLSVSLRRGHEPAELIALLLQQGVNVRGLWPEQRSLESLFLEVMGA
ncbi:MAG: ATP-binding cassette domain-containing protein, partial [Thermoanaerobaculum sp.]